jgi:hypothetical protein
LFIPSVPTGINTKQTVVDINLHVILEGAGTYDEQAALALFDAGVTV